MEGENIRLWQRRVIFGFCKNHTEVPSRCNADVVGDTRGENLQLVLQNVFWDKSSGQQFNHNLWLGFCPETFCCYCNRNLYFLYLLCLEKIVWIWLCGHCSFSYFC